MQRIEIIGFCGVDAEVKDEVAKFTIAVTEKFKDSSGEEKEKTSWYHCRTRATKVVEYIKKGTKLFVRGDLSASVYTNEDSSANLYLNVYVKELELLGK